MSTKDSSLFYNMGSFYQLQNSFININVYFFSNILCLDIRINIRKVAAVLIAGSNCPPCFAK